MIPSNLLQRQRITGHQPGPHLLILGGVHGDEFEPMAAIRRLAAKVSAGDVRGTLTLVPVVNEPAFLRGQRVAEDGLDLARTFPGRADGSVTERIAYAAGELIRAADYLIDLHTAGTMMDIVPLTGYMLHPDDAVLDKQRKMAAAFNLPLVWGTTPDLEGRSLSLARDLNVPAIYAEYRGAAECRSEGVDAYFRGCLNVMAHLAMIEDHPWRYTAQIVVEDPRPNSGHLQINNLSPCAGFFETTVQLGQHVRAGDLLGTVSDLLGQDVKPIHSQQNGMVILLRTFSRVLEGDCLAVVIEMAAPSGADT
jgi:predicted deacylase